MAGKNSGKGGKQRRRSKEKSLRVKSATIRNVLKRRKRHLRNHPTDTSVFNATRWCEAIPNRPK